MTSVVTYPHVRTIALAATDKAITLALSLCVQVDFGSSPGCTEQRMTSLYTDATQLKNGRCDVIFLTYLRKSAGSEHPRISHGMSADLRVAVCTTCDGALQIRQEI